MDIAAQFYNLILGLLGTSASLIGALLLFTYVAYLVFWIRHGYNVVRNWEVWFKRHTMGLIGRVCLLFLIIGAGSVLQNNAPKIALPNDTVRTKMEIQEKSSKPLPPMQAVPYKPTSPAERAAEMERYTEETKERTGQ